ncbi:class I SAM-dependent methyltransferase family protein [Candidatus Bathyarchaeota archaeon]|nr:class I SAM-dependent methyltransferase family protein [Candidatus Bathyarchaeota archaeon]
MIEATCLQVKKMFGNKALSVTKDLKLFDNRLLVKTDENYLTIPLSRKPTSAEVNVLRESLHDVNIFVDSFDEKRKPIQNLQEALIDCLPPEYLAKIPHSMDIIGNVAIVEIPPELEKYKFLLGNAVLQVNSDIGTVLAKIGAISGERRLRTFETIAGTGETRTLYREHRCIYHLDPRKVYFSPRLSQERWRLTQKVQSGEVIIDMFAGVGPFSIQLAKKHLDSTVYAIDINPDAIEFLHLNIIANKVPNVFPILGDARTVIEQAFMRKADRVIMNLPESAIQFIDVACMALKASGGTIHYYGFEAEPHVFEKAEERVSTAILGTGRTLKGIIDSRLIRPIAPHEWQIALDLLLA